MAGFTTVRDVGASTTSTSASATPSPPASIVGPRMLVAVHALGARGGHCDNTGFAYQRFGPETGIADGIASGAGSIPRRGALPGEVRRRRHQGLRDRRRALALRRGRHAAAHAGRDGRARGRGAPAAQAGGRTRARRRRREGRDPRRHRLDRARVVPRRRGGADDEGARHLFRADADGRRIRRRERRRCGTIRRRSRPRRRRRSRRDPRPSIAR